MSTLRITGTFLDEITHDIPSQNWGVADWDREFEMYSRIGLDTVIVIRCGYQNKCIFPSASIPGLLPVYDDLAQVFVDLAEKHGLKFYMGTYDSGFHWLRGSWQEEVEINKRVIDEIQGRYCNSTAFAGWYLCHETSRNHMHIIELFNEIGRYCKQAKDVPVLISPFPQGAKQFDAASVMSLEDSMKDWETIFSETKGAFDICAFQDGQIHYQELSRFSEAIRELGIRHGITIWSNVESFDRDMPIKFPPADWRYLRFKLETAAKSAEKAITFEFPHFLSPNSSYLAAHKLFERYCEHFLIQP